MVFVDRQAGEEAWKQTAASLQPSSTSGHFVYDKTQMHALAEAWEALAQSYTRSVADSRTMVGIVGPGSEYASRSHAVDANVSGGAYRDSLNVCSAYCSDQAAKYRKALGEVVNVDDESHKKLQQSSSPLDGGL